LHNERANFPVSHEILPMTETVIGWLKKPTLAIRFRGGIFRKTTVGGMRVPGLAKAARVGNLDPRVARSVALDQREKRCRV
jgi:hypothetical protein